MPSPSVEERVLTGELLGHYRILEKIGAGGMGEVFRALDEHLDRVVAIKVLPPRVFNDDSARRRFRKEALALSRLNHPNIATIYDFDSAAGVDFLAAEFIEGSSLRDLLAAGPLAPTELVRLGCQLAEGIAAAHAKGVIHRDLKPENILVTPDRRLKILDFGLAVLEYSGTTSTITKSDLAVAGTVPYMAPEQLRGQKLDVRVDIWAVGAVVYEMATGRPPFPQTGPLLIDAILNGEVLPPSRLNRALSPSFDWIVSKCLEKEPRRRYQTSSDLLIDLRKLTSGQMDGRLSFAAKKQSGAPSGRPTPRKPASSRTRKRRGGRVTSRPGEVESLVVLPLTDLSPTSEEEYFADGMTDALISALAKIRSLRVISRTSAMRYKHSRKSLPQIADEVGAAAVIEGSVLRAGGRVRITVQLVEAASDSHLWAETYERSLGDVLLLQSELARAIAEKVTAELTQEEQDRLAQPEPVNTEAYDLYLKGMFHWYKISREHQEIAKDYFELALQKDPNCALAYAGLAQVWHTYADSGFMPPREAFARAKAAVLKAVELNDSLPDIHVALAFSRVTEYNWPAAEAEYRRAVELDPNSAHARFMYGDFLISMRRAEEARSQMDEVFRLDPFNSAYRCFQSWHLLYEGKYDDAVAHARKVSAAEPNFPAARLALWGGYFGLGRYSDALGEARTFYALLQDAEIAGVLIGADARSEYEKVMRAAAEILAARAATNYVPGVRVARFYAHAGAVEPAIEWLEKSRANQESTLLHLSVGWDWVRLRKHRRFQDLIASLRLPACD